MLSVLNVPNSIRLKMLAIGDCIDKKAKNKKEFVGTQDGEVGCFAKVGPRTCL